MGNFMDMTLEERLERLLKAYSHHYDIERDVQVEGGSFPATAFYYLRDENYLISRKHVLNVVENHEYVYFYMTEHLTAAELQRQMTETEIAKREAERKVIAAQAEAQAQRMAGLTEAEIMKAKGYSQKDVLQADVQKAFAEGIGHMGGGVNIGGGGSSGIMGDMMSFGVGMAAMNTMMPQINSMMQGMNPQNNQPAVPVSGGWDCQCGARNIQSKFCPECGAKKPEPKAADTWDCPNCGNKGITAKFCPECGTKKPEAPATWDCPQCGNKGITAKFCPECGHKRGE